MGSVLILVEVNLWELWGEWLRQDGHSTNNDALTSTPEAKIEKGSIHFYRHKNEIINLVDLDVHGNYPQDKGQQCYDFSRADDVFKSVHKIGDQLMEIIRLHQQIPNLTQRIALDALDMVKIQPVQRMNEYPFQISGDETSNVAMALCCKPKLLIADEPTTALDVTIE